MHSYRKNTKRSAFCKSKNLEIKFSPTRLHTGTEAVECAIQTLRILFIANLDDEIGLKENVIQALTVVRFTTHTGLKMSPFELHHGGEPRTELTNIVKDNKSYISDQASLNVVLVPSKQIPIYVASNGKKRNDGADIYGQQKENPMLDVTQIAKEEAGKAG